MSNDWLRDLNFTVSKYIFTNIMQLNYRAKCLFSICTLYFYHWHVISSDWFDFSLTSFRHHKLLHSQSRCNSLGGWNTVITLYFISHSNNYMIYKWLLICNISLLYSIVYLGICVMTNLSCSLFKKKGDWEL